jgi:hypothetical protein
MKRHGAILWILVGVGLSYGAAAWLSGGRAPAALAAAPAQTANQTPIQSAAQSGPDAPASENPGYFPRRRLLMDFLRWQSLSPEERERQLDAQREHEGEEWAGLLQFLKDNSPNRYLLVLRQSPAPRPGSMARNRLLQRWLNLEQLQRNQPALYTVHVEQFKEEDVVIGLVAQLRQAINHGDDGRADELHQEIQSEAGKLVELGLHERALRIDNATALLHQEQIRLDQDKANKDKLVQQRADQIFQQAERVFGRRAQLPTSRPSQQ